MQLQPRVAKTRKGSQTGAAKGQSSQRRDRDRDRNRHAERRVRLPSQRQLRHFHAFWSRREGLRRRRAQLTPSLGSRVSRAPEDGVEHPKSKIENSSLCTDYTADRTKEQGAEMGGAPWSNARTMDLVDGELTNDHVDCKKCKTHCSVIYCRVNSPVIGHLTAVV